MRKFFYVISAIGGFVILFFVSAIISYYLFPTQSEKVSNIYANDSSMAQLNLTGSEQKTQSDENAVLTIVTPSLDGTKTVVRRGTVNDIIKKNDGDIVASEETEVVYEEEEEKSVSPSPEPEKKAEEKTVTTITPSLNNEESVNTSPEQTTPDLGTVEEAPQAEANPDTLNPNVRTSDTGL